MGRQCLTSKIVSVQHQESPLLKCLESCCNDKSHICREAYHLVRVQKFLLIYLNFQFTKKYGNLLCFSRCLEPTSQTPTLRAAASVAEPCTSKPGEPVSYGSVGGPDMSRPQSRARQYRKSGDVVAGRGMSFFLVRKKWGGWFFAFLLDDGFPFFFFGGVLSKNRNVWGDFEGIFAVKKVQCLGWWFS